MSHNAVTQCVQWFKTSTKHNSQFTKLNSLEIQKLNLLLYLIAVRCVLTWGSSANSGIRLRWDICTAAHPIWNITINAAK